ncbi:MAG: DUF5711 family protein [Oscillospiraceae bacterium]
MLLLNSLGFFKNVSNYFEKNQENSFPVIIKNEKIIKQGVSNNGLVVLTSNNVLFYSNNGTRQNKIVHGYTNPVIDICNKRVLTYDMGGNSLRIDSANKEISSNQMQEQILCAKINQMGNVACITSNEQYMSIITVYDSKMNEIYKYYSTDRIFNIEFNENNIIATAVTTRNGFPAATIIDLDINKETENKKIAVNDILPLEIYKNNNCYILKGVFSTAYVTSNETKFINHNGILKNYILGENSLIVTKSEINNSYIVTLQNLTESKELILNEIVKDIAIDNNKIVLLCEKNIYLLDNNLSVINVTQLEQEYESIELDGDVLYKIGLDIIEKSKLVWG